MGTALITGASRGLGAEFAHALAARGHNLVLVARSVDDLTALAAEVESTGITAEVLPADLSLAKGRAAVVRRLASADDPVGLLVNNAGFGLGGSLLETTWNDQRRALDVMVTAVLQLSQAAAQAMVPRGRGAILNVASIASLMANSSYAAHKRWVMDFTEVLALELRGTGVTATATLPGLTRTSFHDSEALSWMSDGYPDVAWLDSGLVVRESLRAVRRGDVIVTPSVRYGVVASLLRAIPRPLARPIVARRDR